MKPNGHYEKALAEWAKRRADIQVLRKLGWTYQMIGDRYGISRERVRQLLVERKGRKP